MCPKCKSQIIDSDALCCCECGEDLREFVKKCPHCGRDHQLKCYEGERGLPNYCCECGTDIRDLFLKEAGR
ncbi:MAG TPA: hypothetical protein PK771_07100 [Spirochaetota bacterium]|nr:hypothetical protein [Spirochaetota bacterium]